MCTGSSGIDKFFKSKSILSRKVSELNGTNIQ